MFCPSKTDDKDGGSSDTEEHFDASVAAMEDMLNFICLRNPEGFYCYDKVVEVQKGRAFLEDSALEAFPDPCNINCSSPTANAIDDLGCCFGGLLDISHRYDLMTAAELRSAKAAASSC